MGKTRAEIQREYRQRKKEKEGEAYSQKERNRVKGYYVPMIERSTKDVKKRREKVNKWVKVHRKREKEAALALDEVTGSSSSQDENTASTVRDTAQSSQLNHHDENEVSSSTDPPQRLIVKMPSIDPKKRTRRRISRATSKCRREMEALKTKNEDLQRNYKRVCRRYERLTKKVNQTHFQTAQDMTSSSSVQLDELTPRKRAAEELRQEGISPSKVPRKLRTKLVLANVLTEEIKTARKANGLKGNQLVKRVVSGNILRKYRMKRGLCQLTGFSRKAFKTNIKECNSIPKFAKMQRQRQKLQEDVTTFLERDDNSRLMPGKNDTKTDKKIRKQKRVLNDNLSYLHLKFMSEDPTVKMSLATFCRMRPKHVTLTKYITRNQCLCQKHQNMALLLKGMKGFGCEVPVNPDEYARKLREVQPTEFLTQLKGNNFKYEKWKKVDMPDGKKRTKIVEQEVTKQEFCEIIAEQSCEFLKHVNNVKEQYKALTDLKENLPAGHVVVQMDFAENFACCSADEVQSAYWNNTAVTLHPIVVYYKTGNENKLKHTSYVYVSDCLGHNISTVYSILKKLVPDIQKDLGVLDWIHYWTDSPSSQYRNKTAFYIISHHKRLLNVSASWNYFEAGHGKGPCDGIGGTAKRMADLTVKQGKLCIQDAQDFYEWGKKFHISAKYVFVSSAECEDSRSELDEVNKTIVTLKGTMQVHAVIPVSHGVVRTRTTSCYCEQCLEGNYHSDWVAADLLKKTSHEKKSTESLPAKNRPQSSSDLPMESQSDSHVQSSQDVDPNPEPETNDVSTQDQQTQYEIHNINEDEWVAVLYQREWHIGQVKEVDRDDSDCLITFLQVSSAKHSVQYTFKWPSKVDEIWIDFKDILCKIQAPKPNGRSGRTFSIQTEDVNCIKEAFQKTTNG